jgi:hypothetical protein
MLFCTGFRRGHLVIKKGYSQPVRYSQKHTILSQSTIEHTQADKRQLLFKF